MQNGYPATDVKFTDRRRYYDAYCRSCNAEAMTLLVAKYVDKWLGVFEDAEIKARDWCCY